MGKMKEIMMDMQEQATDRLLAKILGITYNDLIELEWQIETDENNDGIVNSYRVEFSEDSPKNILNKIDRLEKGNLVYLEPWELD